MVATISTTKLLSSATGETADAWVVEFGDETTVFSGESALERAQDYARGRHGAVNYRLDAQPGQMGLRGKSLGV